VTGTLLWTGGLIGGSGSTEIASSATFTVSAGTNKFLDQGLLNNKGHGIWTGPGIVYLQNGATLLNSGALDLQNDQVVGYNGGPAPSFTNTGVVTKVAGTGISRWDVAFNNNGTVIAASGTVQFNGGGASSGEFHATTGVITFSSGIQ